MSQQKSPLELERERLKLKEQAIRLQEGLPFLYGWKWYTWAREFFESENKLNFLCAANQISKSSTQIRKVIDWCTDFKKWPHLWPAWRKGEPIQFWYLYPTRDQVKVEFEMKWKQFLPTGDFKNHPIYGWREEIVNKEIFAIHFNCGSHIFFKTYAQNVQALQTGTCHGIFCDEELPTDLYDELIFRLSASDGYFHMVFTATLGQEYWRLVMEPGPKETELLPHAFKRVVSMYDCMKYEDGSPSHWTLPKIKMVEARCQTHKEVLRRVHGHFIKDSGLKYPTFDIKRHMRQRMRTPHDWLIYAGIDIGSGGQNNHPAAIAFVAVRPDYRYARVIKGWRGDGVETTAGDVLEKYREMVEENEFNVTQAFYDWASKDFDTMANRASISIEKAEKAHDIGEAVINTLFKNDMLEIHDDPELHKLATELSTLQEGADKRKAKDDFIDALRYALSKVPFDWSCITGAPPEGYREPEKPMTERERQVAERRQEMTDASAEETYRIEQEFAEANEEYES